MQCDGKDDDPNAEADQVVPRSRHRAPRVGIPPRLFRRSYHDAPRDPHLGQSTSGHSAARPAIRAFCPRIVGPMITESLDQGAEPRSSRLASPPAAIPKMAAEFTRSANHSIHSSTLADVLERVLDKGLVIAGDIKIKLLDIELLTIQIRLVVASVDKAREMGLDWWSTTADFQSKPSTRDHQAESIALKDRISQLEERLSSSLAGGSEASSRVTSPLLQGTL